MKQVAVLVGSLREASINRRLAGEIERIAEGRLAFSYLRLGELPHYNDDLWAEPPNAVVDLKARIAGADAILLATPEYNRSVPAVLKNAIDWGSKPRGYNVWAGKPLAIVGASPGQIGAAVAQAHLRSIMVVLEAVVMGQPEVQIAWPAGHDVDAELPQPLREFLATFVDRFAAWIDKIA